MNSASNNAFPLVPFGETPKDNVKSAKRILIVDDNRVVLKVTASKLREYGYEVHTAEDGGSAISMLREVKPDLLLLDLCFPPDIAHGGGVPWDGLLLLSWLRRMTEAEHLQVIAITGGVLPDYKERCLEAGVLDIFLKPIDIEALLATIRRALREAPRVQEPAPAPARHEGREERKPEARKVAPKPHSDPDPRTEFETRKRILLVDDESDWRYMGELYLKECGYEVVTTGDAVGALAQASIHKPHLIVLDLKLGGQKAVTLVKLLADAHPKVPILIYTGAELDEAEVSNLLADGAFECLRKGTMDELLNAIGRALGGNSQKSAVITKATGGPGEVELSSAGTPEQPLNAPPRATDESTGQTETVPDLHSQQAPEVIEPQGTSVLVIASEGELRDSLRSFLEPHSFVVDCVSDGAEALEKIRAAEVDLIVLDMAVSGLAVDEFYRALEGIKPELCQRIVFITNDDVHPTMDGFVRRVRGVTLWQPFPLDELLEAAQTIRNRNSAEPSGVQVSDRLVRVSPG